MKRSVLTPVTIGVLGLLSPAFGADLPIYSKAPAIAAPVYDWTGVYFGVFGGGGYGNHNMNNALGNAGNAAFTANYSSTGGVAGGGLCYNRQSGIYVVGIEGDLFWSGIKGNDASAVAAGVGPLPSVDADNLRWGGTLRVR